MTVRDYRKGSPVSQYSGGTTGMEYGEGTQGIKVGTHFGEDQVIGPARRPALVRGKEGVVAPIV